MPETDHMKLVNETARKGVPFTMYFSPEQAEALTSISRDRRVSKSTIVRFAVEMLLQQLKNGQFDLPFGV
jgi:hypothetical protein